MLDPEAFDPEKPCRVCGKPARPGTTCALPYVTHADPRTWPVTWPHIGKRPRVGETNV